MHVESVLNAGSGRIHSGGKNGEAPSLEARARIVRFASVTEKSGAEIRGSCAHCDWRRRLRRGRVRETLGCLSKHGVIRWWRSIVNEAFEKAVFMLSGKHTVPTDTSD